jgi:hypothetical protein
MCPRSTATPQGLSLLTVTNGAVTPDPSRFARSIDVGKAAYPSQ